jgi:hypothetical protein
MRAHGELKRASTITELLLSSRIFYAKYILDVDKSLYCQFKAFANWNSHC